MTMTKQEKKFQTSHDRKVTKENVTRIAIVT